VIDNNKAQTDLQALEITKNDETQALQAQLDEIYQSRLWYFMGKIQKIRLILIPQNSKRERLFHLLWHSPRKQV
jgi:hypothetical protein